LNIGIFKEFTAARFCQYIPLRFNKAIFQYPAHNSKSLIAILSHKNTVHIVTTKPIFEKNVKLKANKV